MQTAEWLYLALYLSTEYRACNFRQNVIILFWKYFVNIRRKAWLILF